jgi:radical SAM protein with 4Fe4S-binding SPASM domain
MENSMKLPRIIKRVIWKIYPYSKFLEHRLKVKYLIKYGTCDFFNDINIELNTSCTRRCKYCPNSIFDRGLIKNERLMDEKVFKKIIDELSQIKFDGRISPHFFGEPLLDKRLVKFIKYMREKLPKTTILLITNGDLLTIKRYDDLIQAGVDLFRVTLYENDQREVIRDLSEWIKKNPDERMKIDFQKINIDVPLYNRGGLVNPPKVNYSPKCLQLDNPLVIDYNGSVVLCCNDYLSSVRMGNIHKMSLIEIWNSRFFEKTRNDLKNRIYKLDICKRCVGITR